MHRGRTSSRTLLAALTALACLLALAIPAGARPEDRLETLEQKKQRVQEDLDQVNADVDRIGRAVRSLDSQRAAAQEKVDESDAQLDRLASRIRDVHRKLVRAQKELTLLSEELDEVQGSLIDRTNVFTERAVAAYKAGPSAYIDGLLGAETFNDLLDRYEYYESALDTDSEIVLDITSLRDDLERRRADVESHKDDIAHAKLSLETDRIEVQRIRAERAAALEVVEGALDQKESFLAELQANKQRLEQLIAQFEKESSQIEAILAARAATSGPLPVGAGQFIWPADGPVVSDFGMRQHPIFGDTRMHNGIDIAAPYGAPVIASGAGEVIYVGVMSGYGNVVIVDHGSGLATTYNHLSSFAVMTGQRVSAGTLLAAVGCTGYCTGPHLHFEVRINGTPVDPIPFLQ